MRGTNAFDQLSENLMPQMLKSNHRYTQAHDSTFYPNLTGSGLDLQMSSIR
jgi:hypothetical protein